MTTRIGWLMGLLLGITWIGAGCGCGDPVDPPLPPGHVRMSLSLRTPSHQRFTRLRDVKLTIEAPEKEPVVKEFSRVLLGRPLVVDIVVPGNKALKVKAEGLSWDGTNKWGGQWSFALPAAMTEHIGVLTVGRDSKTDAFLPLLFASGSKDNDDVRFWTLPPKGASQAPTIEWKGDIDFRGDQRKGLPTRSATDKSDDTPAIDPDFLIRDANLKQGQAPTIRIDYKSGDKDVDWLELRWGGKGQWEHKSAGNLPLFVQFLAFPKAQFTHGERGVFQLKIVNPKKKELTIAWSDDCGGTFEDTSELARWRAPTKTTRCTIEATVKDKYDFATTLRKQIEVIEPPKDTPKEPKLIGTFAPGPIDVGVPQRYELIFENGGTATLSTIEFFQDCAPQSNVTITQSPEGSDKTKATITWRLKDEGRPFPGQCNVHVLAANDQGGHVRVQAKAQVRYPKVVKATIGAAGGELIAYHPSPFFKAAVQKAGQDPANANPTLGVGVIRMHLRVPAGAVASDTEFRLDATAPGAGEDPKMMALGRLFPDGFKATSGGLAFFFFPPSEAGIKAGDTFEHRVRKGSADAFQKDPSDFVTQQDLSVEVQLKGFSDHAAFANQAQGEPSPQELGDEPIVTNDDPDGGAEPPQDQADAADDGGVVDDALPEPPTPQVQVAKRFKDKGDEGIVFIIPDGDDPADYTVESTCGGEFRTEVRGGKTVLILTVTKIPTKPDCDVTIRKNGRTESTLKIPYGFETDQSDNPNRVRQYINGLLQNIAIGYVSQQIMPRPSNHHGNARNYKVVTSSSNFTSPTRQPFATTDLKTGTITWTSTGIKQKLPDHSAFFTTGRIRLTIAQVDKSNNTVTLTTEGFSLTTLAAQKLQGVSMGPFANGRLSSKARVFHNDRTAVRILNGTTLQFVKLSSSGFISLSSISAGDTAEISFVPQDAQGKSDDLRFSIGDTDVDKTVTLNAPALPWKAGTDYPDAAWLQKNFALLVDIFSAEPHPTKPHEQAFADALAKSLASGKDTNAAQGLYLTLKIGQIAAMERWFCVRKLQGKSTTKNTPLSLLPSKMLAREDAFSFLQLKTFNDPSSVFFNETTAQRYDRLITWGGMYPGNKQAAPLDEPDCSHYTNADAMLKISKDSKETLDARSVVELRLMEKLVANSGHHFPETCRGNNQPGNCSQSNKTIPLTGWHDGLLQARHFGLGDAFVAQFAPKNTDDSPFCTLKTHWSTTQGVSFTSSPGCRYNHAAGLGTFDVARSILDHDLDQWLYALMTGTTSPVAKYKAWDSNIPCSRRGVNRLDLCPSQDPSGTLLLARAQGSYIRNLTGRLSNDCIDAATPEQIQARVKAYRASPSLPPLANACSPIQNMLSDRDLEALARLELSHVLPGNQMPDASKLMRSCYEVKKSFRTVNGRREDCNTLAFKQACQFNSAFFPQFGAQRPQLSCKEPFQYHHELPIHDLRFGVAANECERAFRIHFTYWQYCQFHHMLRAGDKSPTDAFVRGYPLDDQVRCEQYDFNQNNRLDREDAVWFFNLMHQAVRKAQASYVRIFPKYFGKTYPKALLTDIAPKVKAHVDAALTQTLRPSRGFNLSTLLNDSTLQAARSQHIPQKQADGSFVNVTSYTQNLVFVQAVLTVMWEYIASFHKSDPNKWMELMMRLQRSGITRSNESPKSVSTAPIAQQTLVLPMMCAMVLTGRGPSDVGSIRPGSGDTSAIDLVIDRWSQALAASISTTDTDAPGTYGGPAPGDLTDQHAQSPSPDTSLVGSRRVSGHSFDAGQGTLRARVDNQTIANTAAIFAKALFQPLRHRPMLQPRPGSATAQVPASPITITSRFDDDPLAKDELVTIEPPQGLSLAKPTVTAIFGNQRRPLAVSQAGTGFQFTIPQGADSAVVTGMSYQGLHQHRGGAVRLVMKTQARTQQIVHLILAPAPRTSPARGPGRYRMLSHGVRWHHDGSVTMRRRLAVLQGFGQSDDLSLHYSSQRRAFDQALHEYLNTSEGESDATKQALAGGVPTGLGWGHSWDYRLLPFFDGNSVTYVLITPYGVTRLAPSSSSFDPKGNGPFFFKPASLVQRAGDDASWLASLVIKLDATGAATMEDKDGAIWRFSTSGLLASRARFGHGASLAFTYNETGLIVESKGKKSGGEVTGWRLSMDRQDGFVAIAISAPGMPAVTGGQLHLGAAQSLAQIVGDDGSTWSFQHSSEGPLRRITNPAGGSLTLGFDAQQRLTSTSVAPLQQDRFVQQTAQGLTAHSGPLTSSFAYTASQSSYTDPLGRIYTFALDGEGRVTSLKVKAPGSSDQTMASYRYFKAGSQETLLVTSLTDHDGNSFAWTYNVQQAQDNSDLFFTDKKADGARGSWILLSKITTPNGERTITHKSTGLERGLIQSVVDPWGTTTYTYQDRLITELKAPDRTVKYTRDTTGAKAVIGQILSEEDQREQRITCYLYETDTTKGGNGIGQPSAQVIGAPGTCPTAPTNSGSFRTYTLTYNAAGHVLERFDPFTGGTTTIERLADGRTTSHKGVKTWSRRYIGQVVRSNTRQGETKDTTFGALLVPVSARHSVSGGSRCRQHLLDAAGRVVATIGTTGDISLFTYDALDRVIQRQYPTDIRVAEPCRQSNVGSLLSLLQGSQKAYTQDITYGPNTETITSGDVQQIKTYGWFLDGKRAVLTDTRLEKDNGSFAPLRHTFYQYDGRALLLGLGEYGHTANNQSALKTRACVPSGGQALPASLGVSGKQLALFGERYLSRDGQGWITSLCLPDGGRMEWPYDPRSQLQKTFQGSAEILRVTIDKDIWGREIARKRGATEIRRMIYDKDGGVTGQPQVYQEQRLNTKAGALFTYQRHTMDGQGRIARREIIDTAGKVLETITYGYDAAGRLETTSHTDAGSGRVRTTKRAWSDVGNHLQQVTTTSTQKATGASKDNLALTVKRDEYGRVGERQVRRFGILVQHVTRRHHGWGAIASMTLPLRQVTRDFTYDASGRIASASAFNDKDNVPIGALTWRYRFSGLTLEGALLNAQTSALGAATKAMEYTLDYAGRPLVAAGPHREFQYRYDARGNLRCKSVRVEFGKQIAGGRWDASYDALSRRASLKVFPFAKGADVVHCDKSTAGTPRQDLTYTYDSAGYASSIKGTLDQQTVERSLTYHANGLLQRETMSHQGLKQPSQIDYSYSPHGLLEQVGFKASLPATGDQLVDISTMRLTYGTGSGWWSQRSQASLTIHEYHGFLRYNRIGDSRFDLGAHHRKLAQKILSTGFEIIEQKLSLPGSQITGKDHSAVVAPVDNTPEVRLDVLHRYDDHGRMLTRERLLYARARNKTPGLWPFDDSGSVIDLSSKPFKVINNGKFESRQLKDMISCNNTLDTYRQSIATGISPKHPHIKSLEDPSTAFASFADSADFQTVTASWGMPLRRSCENVVFDANGARAIGLHQRMLFLLPQFWVSPLITNAEDRGRLGLYQLMGQKTFTYDSRSQLVKMDVAGMLFEAGGSGPFAPSHEWIDNFANIAGSHKVEYPGKIGAQGNLHFTHHRYWHDPRVLGGLLGWAFPESRESRAPMVVPQSSGPATIESRGALFSSLYDPAGRLFAAFNPPSTVPSPVDFGKVAFQLTDRPAGEQQQLIARYKSTYISSHQSRLHMSLSIGGHRLARIDKSWFGSQSSELDCPTKNAPETIHCVLDHRLGGGVGHLRYRTGQALHPLRFDGVLDGEVLHVSVTNADTQSYQSLGLFASGQRFLHLDKDHMGHAALGDWEQMIGFRVQSGQRQLQLLSGQRLAEALRPDRLGAVAAHVRHGTWASPLAHATPILARIKLQTLAPYTIDQHGLQISFNQTLQIWQQVIQREQNFIRDVLTEAQGTLNAMSIGLGVATVGLPFLAPAFEGSVAMLAALRATIVALELAQVAIVAAEIAAVVQSQGIHQLSFMQGVMLLSGVLSTIIAAKTGLPANRFLGFQRFADRAAFANSVIGGAMVTALAIDGFQRGLQQTHLEQIAFFAGGAVFSSTLGRIQERLIGLRGRSAATIAFSKASASERLAILKQKHRTDPPHLLQQRRRAIRRRSDTTRRQKLDLQLQAKRWRDMTAEQLVNARKRGEIVGPLREGAFKHRVEMQKEVYQFGKELLDFFDSHLGQSQGSLFLNAKGQLDLGLLVQFLKQKNPQRHSGLQTDAPALQQMFKTVAGAVQKEVTELGRAKGIDDFAKLDPLEQKAVRNRVLVKLKEQINTVINDANTPAGWRKAFNDKGDSLGKDVLKHIIASHASQTKNKPFYFNGKTAEDFWNACSRKWTCVKDAYEARQLNPEELYLLREFRLKETRKFINDAAKDLGLCGSGNGCDKVVYAPPAGSDGPTSDYDISWTVLKADGSTDMAASAALIGHATRTYIARIGANAEVAFEHGLFLPPPAFVKELSKLSLQLQKTKPQIPDALAFFIRNLDPAGSNPTKAIADMQRELGVFGANGLNAQITTAQSTFARFTDVSDGSLVFKALEDFITCKTPQCTTRDRTVWSGLFVDGNNKLLSNPTIDPITLALKKHITGCTNATCTDGPGQTAWKTKFFDESTNKLRADGQGVIKDFMGSLIADELAKLFAQLKIPGPGATATEIQAFNAAFGKIIDLDTQLKFLQPESYGTMSTLVHIVEGIQKGKNIAGTDLLGSFFENMGYERHYTQLNAAAGGTAKGDKIQKYGVRVADALQRMVESDTRLTGVYNTNEKNKLKAILDRLNGDHKENAKTAFSKKNSINVLKKDMTDLYQLAGKAMKKLFP